MVQVILKKDDRKLGERGKIVDVSDGYARNYLIPRKLAVLANQGNIKHFESIKRAQAKKIAKLKEEENEIKKKIEGSELNITIKAGENKKLFGSVTNEMVANALQEQIAVDVDKKRIIIPQPIKQLGTHQITAKLKYNVVAQGSVKVIPEEVKEDTEKKKEKKASKTEEAKQETPKEEKSEEKE